MAFLRLPVAVTRPLPVDGTLASDKGELLRLLCGVRMLGARVHLELAEHLPAQAVLRQHAADGVRHHAVGMRRGQQLVGRDRLDSTRISGVAVVGLLLAPLNAAASRETASSEIGRSVSVARAIRRVA